MNSAATSTDSQRKRGSYPKWNYQPEVPLVVSPLFEWPLNLLKILNWFWRSWFPISEKLIIVLAAWISWAYFQPALEASRNFSFDWVVLMWLRNCLLMVLFAGGLHFYFYIFRFQKERRRYDSRNFGKGRPFTFRSQVLDNMFWTIASGVTIWTGYEALLIWGFANGHIEILEWSKYPLWFIAIFLIVPIWESFYFYLIHKWLHWKPLYKLAHHVHHRNTNVGPWSGLSMHPIEHLIFLGSVLVHWIILSHPIHVLYHLQYFCLAAVTTHCGYHSIAGERRKVLSLGTFHHQMHHRFVHCNYGGLEFPWDKFMGSFHDGTTESHADLKEYMRNKAQKFRSRSS